jgi:RNA polymerase sigma factor (sigma-70 family)
VDYYEQAMDDAALVGAACQGDKQAFADIYDRYSDRIYSFLVSLTRNREDAADLLQDTFLTAGARLGQLRDPSKLRPWLYAIARHLAMKSFSHTNRQDPLDDLEVIDTAPEPSERAAQTELAALVGAAAEGLGTQDRVVLELHLRQGLQGQELADALGVTAGHAYVLMSRMRDQVERSLGALMVARQGSKDCRKLEAILKPWDGRFSATWRKRVARHVDGCDICSELRKRMLSPISMLGVVPMMPAPAEAREAILEQVRLVSASGTDGGAGKNRFTSERWPGKNGGFPPPMVRRSRKTLAAVAAAALVLMLFTGSTVALVAEPEPLPSPEVELSFDPDEVFQPPVPLPEPYQTIEVAEPDEPAGPVVPDGEPVVPPGPPRRPSPAPQPPAEPDPDVPTDPGGSGDGGADPPPPPADTEGPALRLSSVNPRQIGAGRSCGSTLPQTSKVTVVTSDPSGIDSVGLSYSGPPTGSKTMSSSGGGTYTATLGPFSSADVAPGRSVTLVLTIRSTDNLGNVSSVRGSLVVTCNAALRAP